MSWSITCVGKPELIVKELERYGGTLSGQSKTEFDEARPLLSGLLSQNFAKEGCGYMAPLVRLEANGSGSSRNGETIQSSCTVKIEQVYGTLLV